MMIFSLALVHTCMFIIITNWSIFHTTINYHIDSEYGLHQVTELTYMYVHVHVVPW